SAAMADDTFARARDFIRLQARVLEQRLFATLFEGAPAVGVLRALAAYRNDDGGFGHGLEPDKLCPDSVVLDVETALDVMVAVGAHDPEVVGQACDWAREPLPERGRGARRPRDRAVPACRALGGVGL